MTSSAGSGSVGLHAHLHSSPELLLTPARLCCIRQPFQWAGVAPATLHPRFSPTAGRQSTRGRQLSRPGDSAASTARAGRVPRRHAESSRGAGMHVVKALPHREVWGVVTSTSSQRSLPVWTMGCCCTIGTPPTRGQALAALADGAMCSLVGSDHASE